MKFKKALKTAGSLAIVSGLLFGCTTTTPNNKKTVDSNVSEKKNVENKDTQKEKETEKSTVKIDTIDGEKITASVLETIKPTSAPEKTKETDKESSKETANPESNYKQTGKVITFTVNDKTKFKSFGKEDNSTKTIADLKVGDIISVQLDKDNLAVEIEIGVLPTSNN